jgi:hypothetical protein
MRLRVGINWMGRIAGTRCATPWTMTPPRSRWSPPTDLAPADTVADLLRHDSTYMPLAELIRTSVLTGM